MNRFGISLFLPFTTVYSTDIILLRVIITYFLKHVFQLNVSFQYYLLLSNLVLQVFPLSMQCSDIKVKLLVVTGQHRVDSSYFESF